MNLARSGQKLLMGHQSTIQVLLVILIAFFLEVAVLGDSQTFVDTLMPGQPREFVVTTDMTGPINYTLTWTNEAGLISEIYAPNAEVPDASSSEPSPQPVSDLITTTGAFRIRVSLPYDDPAGPTPFALAVNYPTSTTTAFVGNEVRDDPDRPPNKWIFTVNDRPSPLFEVRGGNRGFVDYSIDGGLSYSTIAATYVINVGEDDLVTASLPALPSDTAVAYRTRAVAPNGCEARRHADVIYFVTDLPISLDEINDNPPFYRGEGLAHPSPAAWRDQSIYMIVTDRFFNGDPTNDRLGFANFDLSGGGRMHGGDWAGLTAKLDYLKELGITAIWVTPVLQSFEAYHGYAAVNFFLPARQQGTLQELRDFVAEAHRRDMYVILDVVCNHEANLIYNTDGRYNFVYPQGHPTEFVYLGRPTTSSKPLAYPLEFRDLNWFHPYGHVDNFDDQFVNPSHAELGALSGLDDFRTETAYIRNALSKIAKWWIANTDVDGFRLDAVKHVELGFWQTFASALRAYARSIGKNNFFLFGEIFDGNDWKVGRYTGTRGDGPFALDSALYFPMYFTIRQVFKGDAPTSRIDARYANNHFYESPDLLLNFVDNHDVSRFLNNPGPNGVAKLRVALAFIYTSRGIPVLYYGTEQGFNGGRAGDRNREDMFENPYWDGDASHPWDSFDTHHPLFEYIARLNQIRSENIALRRGLQTQRWNNPEGAGLYIFTRRYDRQEPLIVLNSSNTVRTATPRVSTDLNPPGAVLRDQLSSATVTTYDAGGGVTRVNVSAGPYSVQIFKR